MSRRFGRFLLVGGSSVAINMLLFWLLIGQLGVTYQAATVLVFAVGNGYGFLANRRWVFRVGDRVARRLTLYFATMIASLGLNLATMTVLIDGLGSPYLSASLIASVLLTPILYLIHGRVAFGRRTVERTRPSLLLVTHYYADHGGGIELVADQLARRLADRFDLHWHAAGRPGQPVAGVVIHPMRCWNGLEQHGLPLPIPSPTALLGLMRAARSADLVWVHDLLYPANMLAAIAALLWRRPLLVTVHVGAIPYRSRLVRMLMAQLIALTGRLILTRATAVTFVSARVRDEFLNRWRLRRELLVPNGLDTELFRPLPAATRARLRAELGFDRRVMLFVGRFVERKGLHLLRELATRRPGLEWVFAGQGPLDPAEWKLPNVRVERGRRGATLVELYGAADLFVLPSVGEGFPLVVSEALATGLPVLTEPSTLAGYPPAAAVAFGEPVTGIDDVQRWAARIDGLLSDPMLLRSASAHGAAFAREHWDWRRCAETYAELMAELALRQPIPLVVRRSGAGIATAE